MRRRMTALSAAFSVFVTLLAGAVTGSAAHAAAPSYPTCSDLYWGGVYYCGYTDSSVSKGMTQTSYRKADGSFGVHVFVVAYSEENKKVQVFTRWQDDNKSMSGWYNMEGNVKLPPTPAYLKVKTLTEGSHLDVQLAVVGTDGTYWCKVRHQSSDSWDKTWSPSYCRERP
jgi:hypothetical protein